VFLHLTQSNKQNKSKMKTLATEIKKGQIVKCGYGKAVVLEDANLEDGKKMVYLKVETIATDFRMKANGKWYNRTTTGGNKEEVSFQCKTMVETW